MRMLCATLVCLFLTVATTAQENKDVSELLGRTIIGEDLALEEIQAYLDARFPKIPDVQSRREWEVAAERIRQGVLKNVIYRGEAHRWREAPLNVVWDGDVPGGPGYGIRKLRYEALPGMWIPALLYVPDSLEGQVPVHLAVNGHDRREGKATEHKQMRCVNLAKRGMIVLNVGFLGMGQLNQPGFAHNRASQLDLCGTNGVSPFYLTMERGLDLLLSLEHADPDRVAVHGLSGGGWQTILISALDPRVTFANPVAGYSAFATQIRHPKDLADCEQSPCDLATVADYTHLTALRAPRPTLLTYNVKDNCCYESDYALPPLTAAAEPIYRLYGKQDNLTTHVNHDPGDHNFLQDNRQALYREVGRSFFPGDASFKAEEFAASGEMRTIEELSVSMPDRNEDFHSLATAIARTLPRFPALPTDRDDAEIWAASRRHRLREVARVPQLKVQSERALDDDQKGAVRAVFRQLSIGEFTVPAVELSPEAPVATVLIISERGRQAAVDRATASLSENKRVIAVDPFYFGESKIKGNAASYALYVGAVGERPLGLQAGQVAAIARWAHEKFKEEVTVTALGAQASLIAIVAAGVEPLAIQGLELHDSFGSLKEVLEKNMSFHDAPAMFCFGLLESFDIRQLAALTAPRPVAFRNPSERVKTELSGLSAYYGLLGSDFDPLR